MKATTTPTTTTSTTSAVVRSLGIAFGVPLIIGALVYAGPAAVRWLGDFVPSAAFDLDRRLPFPATLPGAFLVALTFCAVIVASFSVESHATGGRYSTPSRRPSAALTFTGTAVHALLVAVATFAASWAMSGSLVLGAAARWNAVAGDQDVAGTLWEATFRDQAAVNERLAGLLALIALASAFVGGAWVAARAYSRYRRRVARFVVQAASKTAGVK